MFWKSSTAVAEKPSGLQKAPVEHFYSDEFSNEQYDTLAEQLGVQCRIANELGDFLREQSIQIFSLAEVERYMDAKGYWSWYPLRAADVRDSNLTFRRTWNIARDTPTGHPTLYGGHNNEVYQKPVPYPVLLTVQTIVERFADDVLFLVAAPAGHPDPFLGVMQRSKWGKLFVIERWDEPGFRG